jgi:hypothetical protein
MSFKFNPTTGLLDLVGAGEQESLKDRILNAPDRTEVIIYEDQNTCAQRISQIEYQAASVSPTASATKIFTYSSISFEYVISGVTWTVVP